jgi:pyruvate dehydrogenase E1 component
LLCDALDQLGRPDGESCYLRLSTRPVDQAPFTAALDRYGEISLRNQVLAGGYRLIDGAVGRPVDGAVGRPVDGANDGRPGVTIVTTGVTAPEAIEAANQLDAEGVRATVVHLTSPDRIYRSWLGTHASAISEGRVVRRPSHLHRLVPRSERRRPVVSVQDAASHGLAWIGSALGTRQYNLGVDRFGESGTIEDLYELTGISTDSIVNAALIGIYEDEDPVVDDRSTDPLPD